MTPQTSEAAPVLADEKAAPELVALGFNHTCSGCGVAISLSQYVFPGLCDRCHAYADLAAGAATVALIHCPDCGAELVGLYYAACPREACGWIDLDAYPDDALCTADERSIKGDL